jgi:hypothetical protein
MLSKCYKSLPFLLMSLVAGLISVYDNTLNLIFMKSLPVDEQNPLASIIIDSYGVDGLIHIKAITTIIAVVAMCILSFSKYRVAIVPVFLFQVLLFLYLTFYTNSGVWGFGNEADEFALPFKLFWEFYTAGEIPDVDIGRDVNNLTSS